MATKNERIKASCKATRERRSGMVCRTFEVKVVRSKLSHKKKDLVNTMFREAKWLRNKGRSLSRSSNR